MIIMSYYSIYCDIQIYFIDIYIYTEIAYHKDYKIENIVSRYC